MRAPNPASLNRKIKLCTSHDVVVGDVMLLGRQDIRDIWASITPVQPSSFNREGYNPNEWPTHRAITFAYPDLDLTTAAWVYEFRRISLPLWYKVVSFAESEDLQGWQLDLRIYNRLENEPSRDPSAGGGIRL